MLKHIEGNLLGSSSQQETLMLKHIARDLLSKLLNNLFSRIDNKVYSIYNQRYRVITITKIITLKISKIFNV